MPKRSADRSLDPDLQPTNIATIEGVIERPKKRKRQNSTLKALSRMQFRWCCATPILFKWLSLIMVSVAVCMIWPYIGWHSSTFDWDIGYIIMFTVACILFFVTTFTMVVWFAGQHRDNWADSHWKWVELCLDCVMGTVSLACMGAGIYQMTRQWYWLCKFPSEHDYCVLRIHFAIATCAYCLAMAGYFLTALLVQFRGINIEFDQYDDYD